MKVCGACEAVLRGVFIHRSTSRKWANLRIVSGRGERRFDCTVTNRCGKQVACVYHGPQIDRARVHGVNEKRCHYRV